MSGIVPRLRKHLEENGIEFDVIEHQRDYRATATARDTHTPQQAFAKTVFVRIDDRPAVVVLPADHDVALARVRDEIGADDVQLVDEEELAELCPDCQVGAAPPFGNLYGLPVYVSRLLAADEQITFNAGTHTEAVRMSYEDFDRLVAPRAIAACKHE